MRKKLWRPSVKGAVFLGFRLTPSHVRERMSPGPPLRGQECLGATTPTVTSTPAAQSQAAPDASLDSMLLGACIPALLR